MGIIMGISSIQEMPMRNPKRYFTFLYVPARNTGLKTIRVPKWLVFAVLVVLAVLVAVSTGAVLQYTLKAGEAYKVTRHTRQPGSFGPSWMLSHKRLPTWKARSDRISIFRKRPGCLPTSMI